MASGYTAKTVKVLREIGGSLLKKIQAELALIDAQLDIAMQDQAMVVGPVLITGTTDWLAYMPCKCDVTQIKGVVSTAFDASGAITASVVANTVAMTGGTFTMADGVSASVAGQEVTATPTAYNEVAAGEAITITSAGTPSAGESYFIITYTPKA